MKNIKRILILFCAFSLVFSVALSSSAFAVQAQYTSTKNFLSYLDTKDMEYTYLGILDDREVVQVESTNMSHFSPLTCNIIFNEDNKEVGLRIFYIVTSSAGKSFVLSTINTINADYKWVKMVYDESDSTIQAEMDMCIDGDHCGRPVYEAMRHMFRVIDTKSVAEALHALE